MGEGVKEEKIQESLICQPLVVSGSCTEIVFKKDDILAFFILTRD